MGPKLSYLLAGGLALSTLDGAPARAQDPVPYQSPPGSIADIAEAAPTPGIALDPARSWLLVIEYPSLLDIDELARDELRLAGLRFHPATNARSRRRLAEGLSLIRVSDGRNGMSARRSMLKLATAARVPRQSSVKPA